MRKDLFPSSFFFFFIFIGVVALHARPGTPRRLRFVALKRDLVAVSNAVNALAV